MTNKVIIYCPDHHIQYDINTLDYQGIGGGATARIRMAHALSKMDNSVSVYINCPIEGTIDGVEYFSYKKYTGQESDVFIASTSGGSLNLSNLNIIRINSFIKILLVEGVDLPERIDTGIFDYVYVLSNFVRSKIIGDVGGEKIFVCHHGVMKEDFPIFENKNSLYKLAYASHPSKGLKQSKRVLDGLLKFDVRYELHVFGNSNLWGEEIKEYEKEIYQSPAIKYHGLIGQKELALELSKCGYYLALQDREEPFGIILSEALYAGCVVIASQVGSFQEIIINGLNGFLINGPSLDERVIDEVIDRILKTSKNPELNYSIQANGRKTPLSWDTISSTWISHWEWSSKKQVGEVTCENYLCPQCGSNQLKFADGYHCQNCGYYSSEPVIQI